MKKIKINSLEYRIPPLSRLNVSQYMTVLDKMRYVNLISYLSSFVGYEIDGAKVNIKNINAAERYFLDVKDFEKFDKIPVPNLFKDRPVKGLYKDNFGAKYTFNLYRNNYNADNIGIIELSVYALAIMISESPGLEDVEEVYQDLLKENWMVVVPIGFFLSKKLRTMRSILMSFFLRSTLKFKSKPKRPVRPAGMLTT